MYTLSTTKNRIGRLKKQTVKITKTRENESEEEERRKNSEHDPKNR